MMRNPHDRWFRWTVAMALILAGLTGALFYRHRLRTLDIRFAHENREVLTATPWLLAIVSLLLALSLWVAIVWILVQAWEYRMSRTSLYAVERLWDPARRSQRPRGSNRSGSGDDSSVSTPVFHALPSAPRRLQDYQNNCIREGLGPVARHTGGLQIAVHAASGSDADDYAHDFVRLFRSVPLHIGKWALLEDHEEVASTERYGVWVRWSSAREKEYGLPPVGRTLFETLRRCGIDVTPLDLNENAFLELIVYRRRPG